MLRIRTAAVALTFATTAGLMLSFSASAVGQGGDDGFKKIVVLVKKGDMAGAKKAAATYAEKLETDEVMHLFKPAKKQGLGVAGVNEGIEQMLIKLGREAPADMAKMADAYTEMGYNIVALGVITETKAPATNVGNQTKKAWLEATSGLVEAGKKLAEAAAKKNAADVKTYAAKVNTNCNNCHTLFR
jgi:hypothetical protein